MHDEEHDFSMGDDERAEECGSYVKIRPNVGATASLPVGTDTGTDTDSALYSTDIDIERKKRKRDSVVYGLDGTDGTDMAALMGFSSFKHNYKS